MKNLSTKAKIFLFLQIIFTIFTFVGGLLLFIGKMDNAGMSVCSMAMSLVFGSLYHSTKNK